MARSRDATINWHINQLAIQKIGLLRPFGRKAQKRALFITESNSISQAQFFPFFVYRKRFEKEFGIEMRELPLTRFLNERHPYKHDVDAVLFQTWFDLSSTDMNVLVSRIRERWPSARITYLDWFAPTDLRYASTLHPHLTAYVKKQILKDFEQYAITTVGDTNLTDYYCRRFDLDLPKVQHEMPDHFQQKLILGSSFEYSPKILQNLEKEWPDTTRSIDVHARIGTSGTGWYSSMRQEALAVVRRLGPELQIASTGTVSSRKYFSELYSSKICFSPFGYGEVCWRDFEAMSCGALLFKPDMSHLKMKNNPFEPFKTYIPLRWDLSDLEEKVRYYLKNENERKAIARNAFDQLKRHQEEDRFLVDSIELWKTLGF